ncbi:MAG: aldehyde dehydrogenase family protein [Tissierellia bacterium]|nr:aldehyde dehydrogenase family protein [Tissierellia bacterium]
MLNKDIFESKKKFFQAGHTLSYDFRILQLKKLKESIVKYEADIINALRDDLNKTEFEAFTSEVGIVYSELNLAIKNLKKWMKGKRVRTPIFLQPGKSYILPSPKGLVLIISPWNYPFSLAILPLIGAIAAGNSIILKPSTKSKYTSKVISKIIKETFSDYYISCLDGGSKEVDKLLESYRFDHIFFTGSVKIGKEIMEKASRTLTPVTLELGGKSPCIVWKDANLDHAAKTITWAKYYNGGQTCIGPDYLLIHQDIKEEFIDKMKEYMKKFYGENRDKNISRIIDENRFYRILELMESGEFIIGGEADKEKLFIYPTVLDKVSLEDEIMKEEIFGPILPILTIEKFEDIKELIEKNPYPLSLYVFTEDKYLENHIVENISFGGGCINDAISHFVNKNLPFGGYGYSGMGSYHGKYSFDEFTHYKSIFKANSRFGLNLKFPPYNNEKLKMAKRFLK